MNALSRPNYRRRPRQWRTVKFLRQVRGGQPQTVTRGYIKHELERFNLPWPPRFKTVELLERRAGKDRIKIDDTLYWCEVTEGNHVVCDPKETAF